MPTLFDPITLGSVECKNRILMAPLTRGRAEVDATPNDLMATYYSQRADAGLVITEATSISPIGYGWHKAGGLWTDSHVKGWKKVTDAVHAKGGKIFVQLWHMGRVSHPDYHNGALPVAPSAIVAKGKALTPSGEQKPYVVPRVMEAVDIHNTVDDYVRAAKQAIEAGFDGVEIHAANGYLLDQFIRDGSNTRDDQFGGSLENRWRFPLLAVDAVIDAIGADKTGIRISPVNPYNDISDSDAVATFTYGAKELSKRNLAYLHVMEALPSHPFGVEFPTVHPHLREVYEGNFILNGGRDKAAAQSGLDDNKADAYAFGVPFIANPDLVERYKQDAELNEPDRDTFYQGGAEGYSDYPTLEESKSQAA